MRIEAERERLPPVVTSGVLGVRRGLLGVCRGFLGMRRGFLGMILGLSTVGR